MEGAEVYRRLKEAADEAQRDALEAATNADARRARVEGLIAERGRLFEGLAETWIPSLDGAAFDRDFAELGAELHAIRSRREREQQNIIAQLERTLAGRSADEAELRAVTERLDRLVERREALEAEVGAILASDDAFVRGSDAAARVEGSLSRDEARVEEVRRDAAEKLPDYDASRLFRYLWDRGFGTSNYASRGLVRRIDRRLARYIGWESARAGYEFLRTMPTLLADEVARRRAEFTALAKDLAAMESAAAERVGLTAVLEEGRAVGEQRERVVERLEGRDRERTWLESRLADLQRTKGGHYREAIARAATLLADMEKRLLERRAGETAERRDDDLVAEIVSLERSLEEHRDDIDDLEEDRDELARANKDLQDLVRHFRAADFDSSRSSFDDDFDVRRLVRDLRDRETSLAEAWRLVGRFQRFRPTRIERAVRDARETLGGGAARVAFDVLGTVAQLALQAAVSRRGTSSRASHRRTDDAPSRRETSRAPGRRRGGFTSGKGF